MGLGYDWKELVHFFAEGGGVPCTVLSHQWRKTLLNPLLHVIYSIFNIQLLKKFNDNLGFQTRTMLPPPFCHSGKKTKKNNKHTKINNDVDYDTTNTSTTAWTEQQRSKTIDLQMTKKLPYKFSPDILQKPDMICLASNEPLSFEPLQLYCHLKAG